MSAQPQRGHLVCGVVVTPLHETDIRIACVGPHDEFTIFHCFLSSFIILCYVFQVQYMSFNGFIVCHFERPCTRVLREFCNKLTEPSSL